MTISTGHSILDCYLDGGLHRGSVDIFYGKRGAGKTHVLRALTKAAVRQGHTVAICGRENWRSQVYDLDPRELRMVDAYSCDDIFEIIRSDVSGMVKRLEVDEKGYGIEAFRRMKEHVDRIRVHADISTGRDRTVVAVWGSDEMESVEVDEQLKTESPEDDEHAGMIYNEYTGSGRFYEMGDTIRVSESIF
jgi:KaiC/GvpD/RAD55 family RecA-like ATPase